VLAFESRRQDLILASALAQGSGSRLTGREIYARQTLRESGQRNLQADSAIERTAGHSTRTARSRSAFAITLTDDNAIAAAATTGDNNRPENGYSTPAASGTPAVL